ncbi:glutathione S-transferase family protein [Haliea sp. E17]|uniref:glutathione S-transferase family protein n=1 Tax=Haliea sp. E17 TaxID=3401576 RepID=UPI003AAB6690
MALTLYYFPTPNGRKVSIALEEMGLDYRLQVLNIFEREAQSPEYLAICPNGRIPAIVDEQPGAEPVMVFESGAILQYLGRKSGAFYPVESAARQAAVDSWVFWQMAGLGPMAGQITWFRRAAEKPGRDPQETSLTIYRFTKEVKRLYAVLENQLAGRDYICDDYSIADMACWTWVDQYGHYVDGLQHYPNIRAWHQRIAERPAVRRAMALGLEEVQGMTVSFN